MESRTQRQESQQWGEICEQLAYEYLLSKGYLVLERNWKGSYSKFEVDIIARQGDDVVFVEVKARNPNWQHPLDAVDRKKMKQMAKAADSYLRRFKEEVNYRFDIITFIGNPSSYKMTHYPDAFIAPFV